MWRTSVVGRGGWGRRLIVMVVKSQRSAAMNPVLSDALLAVILAAATLIDAIGAGHSQPDRRPLDAIGVVMELVAAGALALRRRRPLVVLGIVTVALATYLIMGYPYGPPMIPLVVAMYTVAVRLPIQRSLVACTIAVLVMVVEAL